MRLGHLTRSGVTATMLACALGCAAHHSRPTCSDTDRDCGADWTCVESDALDACVAVIIPYPCIGTHYLCLAQGILDPGEACLDDSECRDGLYCRRPSDGSTPTCSVPECETRDDCPSGQACRLHACSESLERDCGEGLPCAEH